MEKIIEYFNKQLSELLVQKKQLESELERKNISSMEIHRTISRLMNQENDTDSIFRANLSGTEFRNNEVAHLNSNLKILKMEIQELNSLVDSIKLKISEITEMMDYCKNFSKQYEEVIHFKAQKELVEAENTEAVSDNLVENLRNISNKIELALKFEKMDVQRSRMELDLARVKLLFCIEDLEKK